MSFERLLTFQGETLKISEWVERTGLKYSTIVARLAINWPVEKVLMTPCRKWQKSKERIQKEKEEEEEKTGYLSPLKSFMDTEEGGNQGLVI